MTDRRLDEAVARVRELCDTADSAGVEVEVWEKWEHIYIDGIPTADLRALLAALDAVRGELAALRERLARAEADTARLDWLDKVRDEDVWADIWFSSLRVRPYVDRALDAARHATGGTERDRDA